MLILAPFLATSGYLYMSRWPVIWGGGTMDFIAIAAAVAIGLLGISRLPVPIWAKLIVVAAYVPAAAWVLFYFSVGFVCAAFANCP